MSQQDDRKHVVIVGGGFAGATVARTLSKKLDRTKHKLTLVTSRPYMLNLPAAIRATVTAEGNFEKTAMIPYDKLFYNDNGTIKVGTVTGVQPDQGDKRGHIVFANDETLAYDVLVLAPGNVWAGPINFPDTQEETLAHIEKWRKKFRDTRSVVVAGGGAVGIEYAGEVRDVFPHKKATLVHGERLLLNDFMSEKFRRAMEKDLHAAGAEVILNDRVEGSVKDGRVMTRSGQVIEADLLVTAFGGKPATKFLESLGANTLADTGHIKVEKTLQLPGHPNILAAGDAVDWNESKQVVPCYNQASVVVNNVLAILSDKPVKSTYGGSPTIIVVSNGRKRGVSYIGFLHLVLGNLFTSFVKAILFKTTKSQFGYGLMSG
ncbi:FAD/NAD-P-binding domain-containing protein [Peniophora sp. CONT]|nr:FAD/NAD-P-binding domain-containing protein [Peniophora sp. CONT]